MSDKTKQSPKKELGRKKRKMRVEGNTQPRLQSALLESVRGVRGRGGGEGTREMVLGGRGIEGRREKEKNG